jgi:hypothetical protein
MLLVSLISCLILDVENIEPRSLLQKSVCEIRNWRIRQIYIF